MQCTCHLGLFVAGFLLMVRPASPQTLIERIQANLSSEWNEDLEPVIEPLARRLQKFFLPIAQEIAYDETLSPGCLQSLMRIAVGLRNFRIWALKFLDSNGGIGVNKVDGNAASLGGYDECLSIRVPQKDQLDQLDFAGKYCIVSLHLDRQPMLYRLLSEIAVQDPLLLEFVGSPNATWPIELMEKLPIGMRVGICIPSKCENSIVTHLTQKVGGKYGFRAEPLACRDNITKEPIHTGTWISGFVLLMAVILVIWGSICDCRASADNQDLSVRVMRCFSARVSYLKLITRKKSEENRDLDCVHGIRVFSSLWILLAHTYLGDVGLYDRGLHFLSVVRSPAFSIVVQGMLAVDTFFAITGIVVYRKLYSAIVKERILDRISVSKLVPMVLLRRGIRLLVPSLAVTCLLYILPLITSGPGMDAFYPYLRNNCDQRWWTLLLFINNFWSFEFTCMNNQWYNAADMQLLLIVILPAICIVRQPRQGLVAIAFFTIFSMAYTAFLTIYYNAAPTSVILPRQTLKVLQSTLRIGDQALPHLATVCVGILGGYLMEHRKDSKISSLGMWTGWLLSGALSFVVVFIITIWHRRGEISTAEAAAYAFLYRPLWGAFVVWLIFACGTGRAPVIRWILNRPNYIILSRLSYSFYLSQYIVMILKNFTARYTIAFTYYQNFRDFFADMIFNYLLAFLVFLLFEAPGSELEKLVFDKPSVKLLAKANQADGISNGHHVKDILTDAVLITADGKTTNLSDLAVSEPKLESHLSATYKL